MPERVSRRASVQTERDQEGERNRAEKETEETRRERERGREGGGLCAVPEEQKQVAIPQEKGGAFFHLLIGDLNWLQSDRGFPPRSWSAALSSNVTRDFVVGVERRTGRRERDTCSYFLCTQPA